VEVEVAEEWLTFQKWLQEGGEGKGISEGERERPEG
jgi:hypothetical protein